MTFEEEAKERGKQREKYLEDPNFRRLSDLFAISDRMESNYISRLDKNMLACYLTRDAEAYAGNVEHYIEKYIHNPEINWHGLFAYLDERLECQPRLEHPAIRRELINFEKVLNPYRDKILPKPTFVGY